MARRFLPFALAFLLTFGCIGKGAAPAWEDAQNNTTPIITNTSTTNIANLTANNTTFFINTSTHEENTARFWYFAYGSNLDINGMHSRVGDWPEAHPAVLYGFLRTFAGAADIRPNATSQVFGAIYLLSESQMQKLDRYEGAPRIYRRINIAVSSGNQTLPAIAYQYATPRPFSAPSQMYLDTIKKGLLAYGYGNEQIRLLCHEANFSFGG